MGIDSRFRHGSFDHFPLPQQKRKYWDPIATLDIINPNRGCLTCVGYAPSRGRRCYNPINYGNRESAFLLLEALSEIDISKTDVTEKLHQLASLTLCIRYHQGQDYNVVQKWTRQIGQQQKLKNMEELPARDRHRSKGADEFAFPLPTGQRYRRQYDPQSTQEERARRGWEQEARKPREQERERQQRESEKRERERKEREKREQERKKCQEERQHKQEQEARDNEAREREERNERIRQRAKQAREERERKAKEQSEREREEWDKIWLRYVLRWDDIKQNRVKSTSEKLREMIPWPVKSGDCKDVSGSAVEEFFRKAPPQETGANSKKMLALLKMECLKWHTDRIPRMFGVIEDKALASLFNIVAQVVIKIRAEIGRQ